MLTTSELAALLGVTPNRVCQIARARGVKPAKQIGTSHLWERRQAAQLQPRGRGRPESQTK